jgi:hypothetical protein
MKGGHYCFGGNCEQPPKGARVNREIAGFILSVVGIFVAPSVISFACGSYWQRHQVRQQAINAGVAEWRINSQTGERWFEWLKGASDDQTRKEASDH